MSIEEKAIKRELKLIAQYEKKITKLKSQKSINRYKDYIKWGYEEIERIKSGHFTIGICKCGQDAYGWNNSIPICEDCQEKIFEEFE